MQILHVITGLGKAAGTSTFCGEVCNQLVMLDHSVTIAVCNLSAPDAYPLDRRIHLVSLESILHSSTSNFDLLHIHGLWSPILHRVSNWAHARGISVVWSTHGMTAPWALRHKWWKKCLPWYLYQKRDLKRARLIHCTSDFEVEWNKRLGFGRTFLAPLGTYLPEEEGLGRRSRSTVDVKTLLFVGRIYPVKALDRLIEAFALVGKKIGGDNRWTKEGSSFDWTLRLVGPDQAGHMAGLMSLCDRLGLPYSTPEEGQRSKVKGQTKEDGVLSSASTQNFESIRPLVQFVGPKFGADLEAEYANCDALALVSHTENFGATVVDALAHGKPVLVSTNTPWKIAEEDGCGWWVDNSVLNLERALRSIFQEDSNRMALRGVRGRQLVQRAFTWSAVGMRMSEAYAGVGTQAVRDPDATIIEKVK